jgi:hypothetical protein
MVAANPGKPVIGVTRWRHADGSWRYMEGLAVSRFDDPAVNAIVVNYRDITERKKQEVDLQAAKEAAEASDRAKSDTSRSRRRRRRSSGSISSS